MISYILFNTLIYGSIAFIIATYYAYGKFLHASIGSFMVIGTYIIISIIKTGVSAINIWAIVGMIIAYYVINLIVIKAFHNEKQRDLFGLIFTLGASIVIENIVNLIYGPNAISLDLWERTPLALTCTLIVINIIITYLFYVSYNGKIRQAIYSQANSVRSLGIHINRMLTILMSIILPCIVTIGVIIANEGSMKPSDNLFYLIKGIGIMIMVGVERKQYIYLGALVYVTIEYLLFIQIGLPIGFKETLILFLILIILLIKPEGLFSIRSRKL